MVLGDVGHDLFHLLGGVGIDHRVRDAVHSLVAQPQQIVGRVAVGHAEAVVIGGRNIRLAHYGAQGVDVRLLHGHVVGKREL